MVEGQIAAMRSAARLLLQQPLLCSERDSDGFSLVRRHEVALDQWFTRRLGYRLHVSSTTARLFKSTVLPERRALHTAGTTPRPMTKRELVLLSLILAAVAAGPRVISLRDLVNDVRSAATDAAVILGSEAIDRRAFVIVLKWMINQGLATELHEEVGRYEADANADAVLEIDPDRIALVPLPGLARAEEATDLLDRSDARHGTRKWLRARLVEDPVLYRHDLTEFEWTELRRRLGEEAALLDEMFGLRIEARSEGVAAIDPADRLSDVSFPSTNTLNHAALLVIDAVLEQGGEVTREDLEALLAALAERHAIYWSKTLTTNLVSFAERVVRLLLDMRLVRLTEVGVRLLPAAARFTVEHAVLEADDSGMEPVRAADESVSTDTQGSLF